MSPLRIKHLVQFFYGPASAQYFFLRSYFQVWIFFQICSRFLWEQKVAKESESFVATFGRKLSSITLFVHARYGARKVLCTGLMECGGVLVQNSKVQVTPTRGQKIEHAAPLPHAQLGTLHTTQSAQLVRPTNQYGTQSGGIQQSACAAISDSRKTSWTHLRSSQTCLEIRRSVRLR